MPATNPRISVTVQPSVEAVLLRLSELTGQSKSSFIAELLESSLPILERMVTVIEAAKLAKDSLKTQTLKDMETAEAKLHEVLGVTLDIFDAHSLPILQEAEKIKRRKGAAGAGAGDALSRAPAPEPAARPPHVTRGSGTPKRAKGAEAEGQKQGARRSGGKNVPAKGLKRAVEPSKGKGRG